MLVPREEFDIERVRAEWVGRSLGRSRGRFPVELDPIRRHCHMTGDTNPLFLDPDAAADGPHGRVMCPPGFIRYFVSNGPWPPLAVDEPSHIPSVVPTLGDRGVNMGTAWEFLAPVLVGDRLEAEWTVLDVFVKPIRLDPEAVWITTEGAITSDRAGLVARWRNTVLFHRSPAQLGAGAAS